VEQRYTAHPPPSGFVQWIGFIRNANVQLRQKQLGSNTFWIKPVERNHPVMQLRLSMGIVTKTVGRNRDARAWVMQ